MRLQYLQMLTGRARASDLGDTLRGGEDSGILRCLRTRRENFYFLNSDMAVRPPPLMEDGEAEISLEYGGSTPLEDLVLPASTTLGKEHPIPSLQDPSTCLAWFDWLSDGRKRKLLQALQEHGPMSPRELADFGVRDDSAALHRAIRQGVLRQRKEKLEFQFAATRLPPNGTVWTARPPRFWLTRSLEPLRCIHGCEEYLKEEEGKTPIQLLEEMSSDGRKVVLARRRHHLTLNMLYEPSALIPRLEDVGPGSISALWENRRGIVHPIREGYERASMALSIQEEMELVDQNRMTSLRDTAVETIARNRMERYLKARERELLTGETVEAGSGYSLGTTALLSVANLELVREKLRKERMYFEKFLEVLSQET